MALRWQNETFPVSGTRGLLRLPDGTLLAVRGMHKDGSAAIVCAASRDSGKTWTDRGVVASDPERETDIGDGMLLRTRGGSLLYCYRQNHYRGAHEKNPDYAIRVAVSRDSGKSWEKHSTVTAHQVTADGSPSRGLWAPSLLEMPDGRLQCYYDDEKTPLEAGFRGHQWLMMRTWNEKARSWEKPVVVCRAHDPKHLSRDGMGTVVALDRKRLFCALESVQVAPPHAAVVRYVTSDDGGATWSWKQRERGVLYQPAKKDFMSLSPQLSRLSDGTLACIFCTDEDRETPDRAGTPPHRLNMDIKLVTSRDKGQTWSSAQTVADSHRCYLPGLVEVKRGTLLATWVDFGAGRTLGRIGVR
jgi:hypothetical protein